MDGCSDVVCEILYYWPNCEPCSGSSHILKLGLIQRSMRGETLLYHMAFPRIIKTYSVNLDAYQALNQGGWKHSASDTCTSCTQDSNSLEGHGQGWAGQNGAWGSDCEATWADEIGQFHGDCYLAKWKDQDLHRSLWPKPCHTQGTCSLEILLKKLRKYA